MEMKESNGVSVKEEMEALPKDVEEKSMRCTSNFEDHSFDNVEDQSEDHRDGEIKEGEEEEVDVVEWSGVNDNNRVGVSEFDDGNGTDEYSSSFSGTVSDHESDDKTGFNDQEADSMMCTDTSMPFYARKKKLTDHWRKFIQPIMWRCKWVELKIRQLQNQAQIYDKEVKESSQAKQLELENLKSEEVGVKALPPLPCHTQKTQLKKRHKRKRVEEAPDAPSNHNLFSYHAYRKSYADTALNDNSRKLDKKSKSSKEDAVFSEETPPLEFREGDAFLEQILLKIEAAKLEVRNLKNRVDKVMTENPSRFSLDDTVVMLGSAADVVTASEQQNPEPVIKDEDENPVVSEAEEEPAKSASVSSHHDKVAEDDDGNTDILLSEMIASRKREGKAVVPDKKVEKTEQAAVEEEGPSRPVRKRTPRNLDIEVKEGPNPKKRRVSREKPKPNVTMSSRLKLPNRKRKGGKRRAGGGSSGLRRRS
ncbi:hypothetical protein BRARA_H01721 [Brassica rapa]|uniref:BnaA08g15670D protein n=4 Tax=Brassica TaxID=3705 RepID=A0A078I3A7_BRANA|nr:uncharacterized protein BNAA08G15670D [Brassica napus]KAH0915760.1 hypothetical protein HID58_030206 [Brassica napus]RID51030.1 hypothetical protein BRARA_H01721 [Brassica rapa]CDY44039.1 BnaA08g15670D [Brassica napus]VDD05785.1 unnamed protein product [Brassica rapa]